MVFQFFSSLEEDDTDGPWFQCCAEVHRPQTVVSAAAQYYYYYYYYYQGVWWVSGTFTKLLFAEEEDEEKAGLLIFLHFLNSNSHTSETLLLSDSGDDENVESKSLGLFLAVKS